MTQTLKQAQDSGTAPWDDQVTDLDQVTVFRDRYPVTPGHLLFVPQQDTAELRARAFLFADCWGQQLLEQGECDGYNIGINQNAAAGQTVMYPHIHLIPRTTGDTADPVGGVRGVIPGQANYKTPGYQRTK
jgi:diadenosine tetraphosphate (Ap4A) HIT family hydrolase